MISNEFIITRINELCEKQKISHYRLAKDSGIAQSSVSAILNGKSVPTIYTVEKLCRGLGVTLSGFFDSETAERSLSPTETELLTAFEALSKQKKQLVVKYIQELKTDK